MKLIRKKRWNHHLLNIASARPQWLTIKGGAKNYVDVVTKSVPNYQVHVSTPVTSICGAGSGKILVSVKRGAMEFEYEYDHVILATHADQALSLLGKGATKLEREILGAFKTSKNIAVLHSDKKVILPPQKPNRTNLTTVRVVDARQPRNLGFMELYNCLYR